MTKTQAVSFSRTGGPEVFDYVEIDLPPPVAGEVQIRQAAIGLNFIDVYFRNGSYKVPHLPFVTGKEGAGMVTAVGPGVSISSWATGSPMPAPTAPIASSAISSAPSGACA